MPLRPSAGGGQWRDQIAKRFRHQWLFKALGTCFFMVVFFILYFEVLNHPRYPVFSMPLTAVDQWVPFWGPAFYAYASLWFYTSLSPALMPSAWRLIIYGLGIGSLCLIGIAIFYFFPTAVPFQSMDFFNDPARALLQKIDLAGNACPSLHVATALFTGLSLQRQLREMACPSWCNRLNWLWCTVIVYSTMAIKQHVLWDVVAGIALAIVVNFIYAPLERRIKEIK